MFGPLAMGLALGMYVSYCLCQFCLRWVPKANLFFGGIWALNPDMALQYARMRVPSWICTMKNPQSQTLRPGR